MTELEKRLAQQVDAVRQKMAGARRAAGRPDGSVLLCAASKTQNAQTVRASAECAIDVFGENRVQELTEKLAAGAYGAKPVHMIGHLQTNKVKYVVGHAALIHSVDSMRLVDAIEKEAAKLDVVQDILLEVNIGQEESKGGAKREEILTLARHAAQCPHLRLRGLMCIPPATATEEENRGFFQETYQLCVDMKEKLGDNVSNIDCLSMGMSGDYPLAIAGGSTMVRVGTALFGARPPWHPQG